ncbi:hypothetical protein L596_023552 [Steinernema carpocapsae]|uniref:Uncharacterized protein n=1 Tax=Steinernema carpocapsae TaxID=34508 RepID=A0A4U5ME80_STECR|nr:hypothetical protein L596_023552 [Steinernema carpocapsae]
MDGPTLLPNRKTRARKQIISFREIEMIYQTFYGLKTMNACGNSSILQTLLDQEEHRTSGKANVVCVRKCNETRLQAEALASRLRMNNLGVGAEMNFGPDVPGYISDSYGCVFCRNLIPDPSLLSRILSHPKRLLHTRPNPNLTQSVTNSFMNIKHLRGLICPKPSRSRPSPLSGGVDDAAAAVVFV